MTDAMSEAETRAILKQACEVAGLSADGARLLRLGSNAVYRLTAPVVARIARPEADTAAARRMVAVARWLESAAYPAVRALPLDQPIVLDSHAGHLLGGSLRRRRQVRHDRSSCRGHRKTPQADGP